MSQCHISVFGSFAGRLTQHADREGFVRYNESADFSKYALRELEQIYHDVDDTPYTTRMSALIEIQSRAVQQWRNQ